MRDADIRTELLAVLERALELGSLLSDPARAVKPEGSYFQNPAMLEALDRIGEHDGPITLVVGAGASIEADLPSWPRLIRQLLELVAAEHVDSSDRSDWIEAIQVEGSLASAAVAEALATDATEFRALLRSALYGDRGAAGYRPQALARQIAWLKSKLGDSITIATGNFDGLLEQALREGTGLPVHSYIVGRGTPPGHAGVYHLHGRLIPRYSRTGRLILSEASYAFTQTADSWQDRFMRRALSDTLCVFVGLSFTDPNLIRWLYRNAQSDGPPHVGVFVRQGSPLLSPNVRVAFETATRERWLRARVEPVWADFFGEVAQLVHEIGLRRLGSATLGFRERARRRYELGRGVFFPPDEARFRDIQDQTSTFLRGLLTTIRREAARASLDLSREVLGLALWGLDHERSRLCLWANADRRYNHPNQMLEVPLEYESEWVAVEAVTTGTVIQRDPGVYTSPWRLIRGIPIFTTEGGDDGRVIVGALTLTSRTASESTALTEGFLWEIDAFLARVAQEFFE